MPNVYASSVDWQNIAQWQPGTPYTLGQYVRQTTYRDGIYPAWAGWGGAGSDVVTANFGATAFNMTAPSGYSAWGASAAWDTTAHGANITLSNGNLTAARASSSNWQSLRGDTAHTSGKWYFEVHVDTRSNGDSNQMFGLVDRAFPAAGANGTHLGSSLHGCGYQGGGAVVNLQQGWQNTTLSTNPYICIAVDVDNGLVWIRASTSTNWNNSASANPATGVGGYRFLCGPGLSNERVFKCTTAGTSGTAEPWTTGTGITDGGTTTDGTVTWTQVGGRESEQLAGNWRAALGSMQAAISLFGSTSRIYVASDNFDEYVQSYSAGGNSADYIISVNRAGATLPPTASDYQRGAKARTYGPNGLTLTSMNAIGIDFISASGAGSTDFPLGSQNAAAISLEDCTLELGQTNSCSFLFGNNYSFPGYVRLKNTKVKFNHTGQRITLQQGCAVEWWGTPSAVGGTVVPTTLLYNPGSSPNRKVVIHGNDFSAVNTNLLGGPFAGNLDMWDCQLHPSVTLIQFNDPVNMSDYVRVVNCDDSTNSRNFRYLEQRSSGLIQSESIAYRVGGASDGVTPFCHRFRPRGSASLADLFVSNWMSRRVNTVGSSVTLTLEIISFINSALFDTNVWMEVEYLDHAGVPLASVGSTRGDLFGTLTNAPPTSTAVWTAPARQNSHAYKPYDIISVASNPGRVFINSDTFSATLNSAASEPAGFATAVDGGTITDNQVMWRCGRRHKLQLSFTPQVRGLVRCRLLATIAALTNQPQEFFYDPKLTIT